MTRMNEAKEWVENSREEKEKEQLARFKRQSVVEYHWLRLPRVERIRVANEMEATSEAVCNQWNCSGCNLVVQVEGRVICKWLQMQVNCNLTTHQKNPANQIGLCNLDIWSINVCKWCERMEKDHRVVYTMMKTEECFCGPSKKHRKRKFLRPAKFYEFRPRKVHQGRRRVKLICCEQVPWKSGPK